MGVSQGPHQSIIFCTIESEKYLQYILYNQKISGPIICATQLRHTQIGVHIPNMIKRYCLDILRVPSPFHEYASCSVSQTQDSKHLHNKQEIQKEQEAWNGETHFLDVLETPLTHAKSVVELSVLF